MPVSTTYIFLFVVVAIALFLRTSQFSLVPAGMWPDECVNGIDAMNSVRTGDFKVYYPGNFGREGLYVWLNAISISLLGNTVTGLRAPSAVIGVLTIIMVFFTTRRLLGFFRRGDAGKAWDANAIALLAAIFLAASHWHVGFSRVAFRAILDPLAGAAAIYAMIALLERPSYRQAAITGLVTGTGLYCYSSFRFVVFPLIFLVVYDAWRRHGPVRGLGRAIRSPHLWTFALVTALIAVPLVKVALDNPKQFFQRAEMVSVFKKDDPGAEFRLSAVKALGQFHVEGDPNWRHNFHLRPALPLLLGVFFAAALIGGPLLLITRVPVLARSRAATGLRDYMTPALWLFLVLWVIAGLTPAALTFDGRPHFLRSISAIPPTYILTALGTFAAIHLAGRILPRAAAGWAVVLLAVLIPAYAVRAGYESYFDDWANHPSASGYYMADVTNVARRAAALPDNVDKFVVVGWMPHHIAHLSWAAQPVVYLSHTETEEAREAKRMRYILMDDIESLTPTDAARYFLLVGIPDEDKDKVDSAIAKVSPNATVIR